MCVDSSHERVLLLMCSVQKYTMKIVYMIKYIGTYVQIGSGWINTGGVEI